MPGSRHNHAHDQHPRVRGSGGGQLMAESAQALVQEAFSAGSGVVRLMPAWVPRAFCVPGRRLRLHPRDLYALGGARGGIDERWFASATHADNGPGTPGDEGLSYIWLDGGRRVTLKEAFALSGSAILGEDAMNRYGGWVMFAKFFDNYYLLPHHLHQDDAKAAEVGMLGKPESYYYPPQYNAAQNTFPYTFFGLEPGTTRDQVIDCLRRWDEGDNGILGLSRAYRLNVGDAWNIPTGVLHAPGTLCTYEPQRASDVFSMWQSLVGDYQVVERAMLVKHVPAQYHDDYDYLFSLLDWDENTDPNFRANHFVRPVVRETDGGGEQRWIVHGTEWYSAKEVTVAPGESVHVRDAAAYGAIAMQGYGRFGAHPISAPTMIRFGAMTEDEFFVTAEAAQTGVTVTNLSSSEPLVFIQHFNPGNPDVPAFG
jgi:hypothetical protein